MTHDYIVMLSHAHRHRHHHHHFEIMCFFSILFLFLFHFALCSVLCSRAVTCFAVLKLHFTCSKHLTAHPNINQWMSILSMEKFHLFYSFKMLSMRGHSSSLVFGGKKLENFDEDGCIIGNRKHSFFSNYLKRFQFYFQTLTGLSTKWLNGQSLNSFHQL